MECKVCKEWIDGPTFAEAREGVCGECQRKAKSDLPLN